MTSNAKICDEINISAQRGYTDEGQCQDGLSLFIWLAEVSVERLPGLCRSGCDIEACGYRRSPGAGAAGEGPADWDWPLGYRDQPPGGCRSGCDIKACGYRRSPGAGAAGEGPADWDWPLGYRDEPPGGCRAGAGRGVTSRPACTGDHQGGDRTC